MVAQEHYWTVTDTDWDTAIEKLATKVATGAVSEGLQSSLDVSGAIGVETKKAPSIQGFDAICRLMSSLGETAQVDDIGLEPTTPTMSTWCSNQLS